jgi:DNA-binding MarR family transcriptional regulator
MSDELAEVMDLVQRVQRAVHRSKLRYKSQRSLTTGLTMAQLRALMTLADSGQLSVGQLAERLGIGMPAASSIIDRLVEEGLADRRQDTSDRRRTVVRPTSTGSEGVDAVRQGPKEVILALIERMSPAERRHLILGMQGLARAAEEVDAEAEGEQGNACPTAHPASTAAQSHTER